MTQGRDKNRLKYLQLSRKTWLTASYWQLFQFKVEEFQLNLNEFQFKFKEFQLKLGEFQSKTKRLQTFLSVGRVIHRSLILR